MPEISALQQGFLEGLQSRSPRGLFLPRVQNNSIINNNLSASSRYRSIASSTDLLYPSPLLPRYSSLPEQRKTLPGMTEIRVKSNQAPRQQLYIVPVPGCFITLLAGLSPFSLSRYIKIYLLRPTPRRSPAPSRRPSLPQSPLPSHTMRCHAMRATMPCRASKGKTDVDRKDTRTSRGHGGAIGIQYFPLIVVNHRAYNSFRDPGGSEGRTHQDT